LADSVTYQRIVLDMQSPWNLGTETNHVWHNKFSLSGSIAMNPTEAEATAIDLWQPLASLCSLQTSLVGWSYYLPGKSVSEFGLTYDAGVHVGTRNAYDIPIGPVMQLEVCALAIAPCGRNSRGKQVYLRKWIHDVTSGTDQPNSLGHIPDPTTVLTKWNHGSGPHSVVPVDPTGGAAGGPWTLQNHLYTHQLRRGPKRKRAATSTTNLLDIVKDAAALRQLLGDLPPAP
jgi:hypothetical protein